MATKKNDIVNAPIAWVAPPITPITPVAPISNADVLAQNKAKVQGEIQAWVRPPVGVQPIDNKQVLANNQAKVAWEIQAGTRPAVWQQSESLAPPTWTTTPSWATLNADWTVTNAPPVNATANPTTPAPTATPTTATASNTATWAVDFNVWAGREQDIVKNLQTFKTQGMDDNAIKQASGYATADATKKAQIDGFLAGQNKPLDEGTVFNAMMAWTPPPIQNTPDYRSAKYRYDQFQKFNGMSTPQLVDNLKQGEITTEMNNLLAQNPNYQLAKQQMQAYQNTQNINNAVNGFSSGINGKEIGTPDYLQALSDKILTKLGLSETSAQQAFKDIVTNDSKVVEYTNQLSAINRQVADTTKLLNDGYEKIMADHRWLPKSALITMMNSRFKEANDLLSTLNNSKSYLEADLKNAVEMARGEYEAAAQDIQQSNALRNNVLGQAIWAEFNIATKQIEDEIDRKAKAAALKDPATAIQTVMDEYKKLWVPFTESLQTKLADANAYIQAGGDIGSYIDNMIAQVQAKPEYKRIQQLKSEELSDLDKLKYQERSDLRNFAQQKELAYLNQDLDRQNFLFQIENDPEKRAKAMENEKKILENASLLDLLWVNVGNYEGNRGYDLAGKKWDPVPAWGNWKVDSIIDANYSSSLYWNSVVMIDENGNKVRYSHLESIWVKKGDTLWFGDIVWTRGNTGNVLGKNGEKLTAEQLKAWRGSHVDVEIKDSSGRLLSQAEQVNYLKSKRPAMQLDANALSIANWVWDLSDLTPTDKKTILPQLEQIVNSRMTGDQWRDAIVKSALYKKDVSDSTLQKITDMQTVAFQLDWIQERLANQKVWPILGQIKKLNPYDTEAQMALAELAGITPKVARGIFWEVWVLTDTDIANYQKTLPNLTSTEEKNAFVVDVMRKLLAKWVVNTIETQARWQRNMSPFLDVYDKAKSSMGTSTSKYE